MEVMQSRGTASLTITLPQLEPWQKDLVTKFQKHPKNTWFVTKAIRQVGKSILIEWLLTYASLQAAGSYSLVISPIFSQSRKLFDDMAVWCKPLLKKCNGATLQMEFINGSKVEFGSAEQGDNLRGKTIKKTGILCLDEAAFVDENFFYEVLVPTTNVFNSDIFIFSTPKFKQGLFYNLYMKGIMGDGGNVISCDWTKFDTSKFLSPTILDMYRTQLPKLAFKSEYEGEFIDGDGAVFSDFKKCVGRSILDQEEELWVGIDWSTGQNQDSTVLTFGQYKFGKVMVDRCVAFNDRKATQTIDTVIWEIHSYVTKGFKNIHIIVEKNSIGNVFYDILCQKVDEWETKYNDGVSFANQVEIRVGTFNTSSSSKERIIKNLIVLFENDLIILPDDEKLLAELSVFECTINKKGTPVYGAPVGHHDDRTMSLAILCSQLYNEVEL